MTTTTITEDKLAEMLQENTGKSFLDSGGAYGRHWQRNQNADFETQPSGCAEFYSRNDELDIVTSVSVFHFLRDRLEYNPQLDQRYREWCEENGEDPYQYGSAEDFALSVNGKGIYQDGEPITINTANGEDMLSQTLQYIYWTDDDGAHVLLQIHGGCDIRGGYTDPVAFDLTDYDGTSIFDNARATIYCDDCNKYWDTDDGCRWRDEGGCNYLDEYPATDEEPDYPERSDPSQKLLPLELPERPTPDVGAIWVDDDRNAHCPHCGGILHVAPQPA